MFRSDEPVRQYWSTEWHESTSCPGVRYQIVKISLARRAEITRRVRTLLAELEYHGAGESLEDRLAAAEVASRVDQVYIDCGLLRVEGLEVDGQPCDSLSLVVRGPEELSREIAAAIRRQCRLSEEERKN